MELKILLNINSVNINLQTLTAKNRLNDCAGFLGLWELLYIETRVTWFFQIAAFSCLMLLYTKMLIEKPTEAEDL